ncbi:MAG: hypothetical protein AAFP19_01990 [Bacteroidota bacterium]
MALFQQNDSSPGEPNSPWGLGRFVFFFLLFVSLFFLIRINKLAFLLVCLLSMIGLGAYYLYQERKRRQRKANYAKSTEGIIDQRMDTCAKEIHKNREEIKEIRKSIAEIEEKIKASKSLKAPTLAESEKLISAFKKELELRSSKIRFYESCRTKLLTLRDNHQMLKAIGEKQEQLKLLRESHYEDLANMESMRTQLELDKTYLQTIDTLSLRMLNSHSLDSVQELELELNQMTKELRRL